MLLPYMHLDKATREIIIKKEIKLGQPVFETIKVKVDGIEKDVIVCKKWGGIFLDAHTLLLCDDYPIIELNEINFVNKLDSADPL